MRFWDSSALVPLLLAQPRTAESRTALMQDREMVVWWGSSVECASAIARLHREGILDDTGERSARDTLTTLARSWYEVQPGDALREQALRLLRIHHLRAADALQLAAAMERAGTPVSGVFVCFDERLRNAARREGFDTTY